MDHSIFGEFLQIPTIDHLNIHENQINTSFYFRRSIIVNRTKAVTQIHFTMEQNIIRSYDHWLFHSSSVEIEQQIVKLKKLEDSLSRVLLYKLESLHKFLEFSEKRTGNSYNDDNIRMLKEVNIRHKSVMGIRRRIDAAALDIKLLLAVLRTLTSSDQTTNSN